MHNKGESVWLSMLALHVLRKFVKYLDVAIYAGADAVYLGLDLFNARIKADNFNKDKFVNSNELCYPI